MVNRRYDPQSSISIRGRQAEMAKYRQTIAQAIQNGHCRNILIKLVFLTLITLRISFNFDIRLVRSSDPGAVVFL